MVKNKLKRLFRSYSGRHFLSRWVRIFADYPFSRQLLSLGLIVLVFSSTILNSQTLAYMEILQTENIDALQNQPIETATKTAFQSPLKEFNVSQSFSWHHWGIDLTAHEDTKVYPVTEGRVIEKNYTLLGFGNYLLIQHPAGQQSLYAHLSKVEVKQGDAVQRDTVLGLVGHTGRATGNHLHLEIHQNGLPLDPFEVLPEK